MTNQKFSEWIEEFGKRVQTLRSKVNIHDLPMKASSPFPLHALHTAHEELNAAEEELRLQNEELRTAYEQANAERLRYQELFEFAHDGYVVTDSKGTIVEANRAAGLMLNIAPKYLIGKPLIRFLAGDNHQLFRTEMRQLYQTQRSSEMTVRIEPRAAASFYVSLTLSAMVDAGGQLTGIRWMLRDVTEPLKSRQQIQILQEEAEQRQREQAIQYEDTRRLKDETLQQERSTRVQIESQNKAKDHLFAAISHELRTPLGAVIYASEALKCGAGIPEEEVREFVDIIQRNAQLLNRLTGDLVDLAGITCGKLKLRSEQMDVHVLLKDVLQTCQSEINEKALAVSCDLNATSSTVCGDGLRLRQVFWNILRNAIKFSSQKGKLTIATGNSAENRIRILVTDTGMGIEPAMIARIFDIFEQADPAVSQKLGGLGLGLMIARNLVEAHGGTITANSDGKGKGATFTVELPCCKEVGMSPS